MKRQWRAVLIFIIFPSLMMGCLMNYKLKPTRITLFIESGPHINNDVLLPLDIIAVDASFSDLILDIGPEAWFGHSARGRLVKNELRRFAISSGETRKIEVNVNKKIKRIIIYADYEKVIDRRGQQVIIEPKRWRFNYTVRIGFNEMELL